jgi:hypothetical protein
MNLVATLHKIGDPILSYGTTSIGNKTDSHPIFALRVTASISASMLVLSSVAVLLSRQS